MRVLKPRSDGGPAFPRKNIEKRFLSDDGMSLHDYYVGQILTGAVSGATNIPGLHSGGPREKQQRLAAEWVHDFATMILKVRKEKADGS